jgi:E3 ubiquitin-protein ligase RNF14
LNPIFRCAECNFRSCITHNVAWHYSLTCVEYDNHLKSISARKQQEREEAASRETAEKISKRCPGKDCGWRIEKSSGCDHMRCWKCGTEFCWICGAGYDGIWENGNSEHRSSCKHYRPIPQTQWQSRASNRVQPDVILTDL